MNRSPFTRAVVDIGSNSVKYTIAEIDPSSLSAPRVLEARSWVTRLGAGSESRTLLPESIEATRAALLEMKAAFARRPALDPSRDLVAVATSAVRDARNPEAMTDAVAEILGVPLRVLSGDEEARISLRGASHAGAKHYGRLPLLFIDIGGASTEIGMTEPVFAARSFQAGAVRCLKALGFQEAPIPDLTWARREERLETFFTPAEWDTLRMRFAAMPTRAVTVGGTLVLAAKLLDSESQPGVAAAETGWIVPRARFEELNERLRGLSLEERLKLPFMVPGRADIVCVGLSILCHVLRRAGITETLVTDWGLRHGLLLSTDTF